MAFSNFKTQYFSDFQENFDLCSSQIFDLNFGTYLAKDVDQFEQFPDKDISIKLELNHCDSDSKINFDFDNEFQLSYNYLNTIDLFQYQVQENNSKSILSYQNESLIVQANHPKLISQSKPIQKSRKIQKYYNKNIHRYITRQIIRQLSSKEFQSKVNEFCHLEDIDFQYVKEYYLERIENFTSINLLRDQWTKNTSDQSITQKRKNVFRKFSKWFLKEKAIRYIIKGNMKNKKEYIKYKNDVMLKYIENPKHYYRNYKE